MITKLIILYLLIMFFSFRIPSQKSKRGLKRKKLQERTPVVFHLHNVLDSVELNILFAISHYLRLNRQPLFELIHSSIALAARRPSPIARITVAPPRTMSPPAKIIGIVDCMVSLFTTNVPHLVTSKP